MNDYLNKGCKQVGNGQRLARSCVGERDGERRYAQQLWKLASVYLSEREYPKRRHRKVWREGLEVAIKVKWGLPNVPSRWKSSSICAVLPLSLIQRPVPTSTSAI